MPPARSLLLDAASSYALNSEDRLTELLAVALSGHESFALALAERAGLSLRGPVRVTTQLQLASGRHARPDMQLAGRGPDGTPAWLWIENKIFAPLTEEQARGYPAELHANRSVEQRRLILIAADARPQPSGWDKTLTWQQVALLADQVAREQLGEHWRQLALKPEAQARWRILAELLWYLEHHDLAMIEPLTTEDLEVFRHFERVSTRLEALLSTATPLVQRTKQDALRWTDDGVYQNFRPKTGDWIRSKPDGYICVELAPYAYWLRQGREDGAAHAGAGYALPHAYWDSVQVALSEHDLPARRLTLWSDEGEDVLVYASLPLSELTSEAASVPEQAAQLAQWTNKTLDALAALNIRGLRPARPARRPQPRS